MTSDLPCKCSQRYRQPLHVCWGGVHVRKSVAKIEKIDLRKFAWSTGFENIDPRKFREFFSKKSIRGRPDVSDNAYVGHTMNWRSTDWTLRSRGVCLAPEHCLLLFSVCVFRGDYSSLFLLLVHGTVRLSIPLNFSSYWFFFIGRFANRFYLHVIRPHPPCCTQLGRLRIPLDGHTWYTFQDERRRGEYRRPGTMAVVRRYCADITRWHQPIVFDPIVV